ncbi:MAG: hypothetical protein IPG38_12895 [Chitinophagaceae bacterium]|nr:hypothetical protein [Chitinophagaceae bacterium]
MKIEQLLVQHFYNSKEVTLQGMGTFTLSGDFVMPKKMKKMLKYPSMPFPFNTMHGLRKMKHSSILLFSKPGK